jgi:hypothetical protein
MASKLSESSDEESAEKKAKIDEDCYYVYAFKRLDCNDLYFGHGTTKSSQCREFAAIYPDKNRDKEAVS